jgi:hypothetical protein
MVSSNALTPEAYLASLPADRRAILAELRRRIARRLPAGFEECMEFGMLAYVVPLSRYPETYNERPLMLAALASQKAYLSLYLMNVYGDRETERWLVEGFRRAGKPLLMGKSCIRFTSLEDLPLDVIEEAIARVGVDDFIALHEAARGASKSKTTRARKPAAKRTSATTPAAAGTKRKPAAKRPTATPTAAGTKRKPAAKRPTATTPAAAQRKPAAKASARRS